MQTTMTNKPLSGLKILITRPKGQAQSLSEALSALGATTIEVPTIKILPASNLTAIDEAAMHLNRYDWVIFTSVQGVHFFKERLDELQIPASVFEDIRVAAIGPATATALEDAFKKADYVPAQNLSEKIVEGLGDVSGMRILLPRADIASKTLPTALRARGALVDELVAYRTVIPQEPTREELSSLLGRVDLVTFTSPSTVQNLANMLGQRDFKSLVRKVKVACIGPVTEHAARRLGIAVDIVAKTHTVKALVEAIVNEI
jgi:uroporphyrinogen III methyltransferase/synthase